MNRSEADFARAVAEIKRAGITLGDAAEAFKKLGLAFNELDRQMKALAVAQNSELIKELRDRFDVAYLTDWEVLVATQGTLGRAMIELKLAWRRFWREVWK